ncbi:MAG: NUDIX hydrolase [Chloroflexi bacterium]|nr:NUDIX hydrolase [Chloroflexota bacterium]MCI0578450.1 NUDIX hydrolase [Chloroflexota bacterium]MCI0643896.1 NUDIX hydrolase [Chloroflexota bacterium]MCI0729194.1 NUDIX hydrolase [Chloroflexota bacterium]
MTRRKGEGEIHPLTLSPPHPLIFKKEVDIKLLNSRVVWQGKSWRLRVDTVALPDGVIERGVVEHPGSVVLVPLLEEQILMLRQYRPALEQTILELPAGTRGWDEAWLVCAQRELQEETGYRAGDFLPLGDVWPAPGMTDELMAFYLARDLSPAPLPADADEIIELQPMPLPELVTMALDGRLQDAKSVVGILRTAAHLGIKTNIF